MVDATRAAEAVSTRRGTWSVILAATAVPVSLLAFLAGTMIANTQGPMGDPRFGVAFGISNVVVVVLFAGMTFAAMALGVTSIVRAWPQRGRAKRRTAITLGFIGSALALLIDLPVLLWQTLPLVL
jgi:hypothetical protein